jgi:hypothetical protein
MRVSDEGWKSQSRSCIKLSSSKYAHGKISSSISGNGPSTISRSRSLHVSGVENGDSAYASRGSLSYMPHTYIPSHHPHYQQYGLVTPANYGQLGVAALNHYHAHYPYHPQHQYNVSHQQVFQHGYQQGHVPFTGTAHKSSTAPSATSTAPVTEKRASNKVSPGDCTPRIPVARLIFDRESGRKRRRLCSDSTAEDEIKLPYFGQAIPSQPKSVLSAMLSYLSNNDLHIAAQVCRWWKQQAVDEALKRQKRS